MPGDNTTQHIPELAQALLELSRRVRVLEDHVQEVERWQHEVAWCLRVMSVAGLLGAVIWVLWH